MKIRIGSDTVDTKEVIRMRKKYYNDAGSKPDIWITTRTQGEMHWEGPSEWIEDRWDEVFSNHSSCLHIKKDTGLETIAVWDVTKEKGGISMESLKAYFVKHQDSIITLAVIVLLDHVLFGGALRDRIQTTVEKILGATEKKLAE